jgi:hypothetical protein
VGAEQRSRLQPQFSSPTRRAPLSLQGRLGQHWVITTPLLLTAEVDDTGWFVVSDEIFLVYGDGATLAAAWEDYKASLIDYCEMVRRDATRDIPSQQQYEQLSSCLTHVAGEG